MDSMRVRTRNGVGLEDRPGAVLARPFAVTPVTGRGSRAVAFELAKAGPVRLRVLDNAGRVVATLADAELDAGHHSYRFTPRASGVYVVRMDVPGSVSQARRITVLN